MPLYTFEGRSPRVDPTAFVAPTATLIGDVTVEAGASVWFNTVLRADYGPVIVREGANVQDGSVLHSPPGIPVDIGPGATVAHMCIIHGAHIGAEALIANHATVLGDVKRSVQHRVRRLAQGGQRGAGRGCRDSVSVGAGG
jgi:carbonic anhydrase/acetyltransferase-like protein (isoleucine patch superfamily)